MTEGFRGLGFRVWGLGLDGDDDDDDEEQDACENDGIGDVRPWYDLVGC